METPRNETPEAADLNLRLQGIRGGGPLAAMVEIKRSVARCYNVSRSKILRL
jgi:hypothetical protein